MFSLFSLDMCEEVDFLQTNLSIMSVKFYLKANLA